MIGRPGGSFCTSPQSRLYEYGNRATVPRSVRSSWLAGLLLTIVSLAWNGGATAHVGHHATVADCCYEIAYDQYEEVYIWFVANGNRARMQGAYRATVSVHLRTLATAVTDPKYVHFLTVTEERAASMDEFDATEMRTPAPNRSAQPGPPERQVIVVDMRGEKRSRTRTTGKERPAFPERRRPRAD